MHPRRGCVTASWPWRIVVIVDPRSGSGATLWTWSLFAIIYSNYGCGFPSMCAVGQPFCYYEGILEVLVPLS